MEVERKVIVEDVERKRKEGFDTILEKIKKMSDAIELHNNVKKAVLNKEVDNNYLKYVENSLEDKLFSDAKFDKIKSKVLLEIICPKLIKIENMVMEKLEIVDLGNHFEENINYIDKICTYDGKFICLFGVQETNIEKAIEYETRKFSRIDRIDAICKQLEEGKTVEISQYDEYYIVTDELGIKVFSDRKSTDLLKIEETIFDKIKSKLITAFNKKKYESNIELIYDTNPNRLKNFKINSKIDAKKRMKALLLNEREVTRNTTI